MKKKQFETTIERPPAASNVCPVHLIHAGTFTHPHFQGLRWKGDSEPLLKNVQSTSFTSFEMVLIHTHTAVAKQQKDFGRKERGFKRTL